MDRRETYRTKALKCLLAAEKLRDPTERIAVLQIAQSWMSLADHVGAQRNLRATDRFSARSPQDRTHNDN